MSRCVSEALREIKKAHAGLGFAAAALAAVAASEADTVKIVMLATPKNGEGGESNGARHCPLTGIACPVDAHASARTIHRALSEATSRLSRLIEDDDHR